MAILSRRSMVYAKHPYKTHIEFYHSRTLSTTSRMYQRKYFQEKTDPESKSPEKDVKTVLKSPETNQAEPYVESPLTILDVDPAIIMTDDSSSQAAEGDFLTTIFENMEPYIDTYEAYKELLRAGFTPSQSDEIISMLIVQLNSKLSKLSTKYSQAYELENEQYLFESAQQELRVDITRNRENHINELINQINALERDFDKVSDELNNHFIQMKNDIQVAINDQKSENTLKSKKIMLRIQETNHKITTEVNMAIRSEIESLRWHLSRWGLIAILVSVFSTCVVYYTHKALNQGRSRENEFVPLVIYEPSEFDEDDYHADLDPNTI
ncbi:CIC11C00000000047 [Sungouiella intermedia]|uniref:CIC11C00000000047 n=1 Tax=Sungouiella intermedia TaxID=45354 RepID=A0A1L0BQN6_9ASCO|nr:CIC11C00000000047 [[Candida] intermedia]